MTTDSNDDAPTEIDWDEIRPSLLLSMVPGVGPLMRRDLLDRFGSAQAVLDAAPSELREVPRLGPKLCRAISTATREIDVQSEIDRCRDNNIRLLAQCQDLSLIHI